MDIFGLESKLSKFFFMAGFMINGLTVVRMRIFYNKLENTIAG